MAETVKHETVLDSGQQQAAAAYAKALLGAATAADDADRVLLEFDTFLWDVLDPMPKLEATLAAPRVPVDAKLSMLDEALADKTSVTFLNFLKVVCKHRRFECIRAMHRATHQLFDEMTGRVAVEIRTASPLDESSQLQVAARLEQVLGKKVTVTARVDEGLIGGIEVRVGDTIYDGSLAGRLKSLRTAAVENAARAIAQTVDRFDVED
jgi:F-type H+-transporting ATPase subunit delta